MKTYSHNGVDCLLCLVRNVLVKKYPEEVVRQRFIQHLIRDKGYPKELISVEYALSRTEKGNRKRADIVIYRSKAKSDTNNNKVILTVECKRKGLGLTSKHHSQIDGYNKVLKSKCYLITNGNDHNVYILSRKNYERIGEIPSYIQLLNNESKYRHFIAKPYIRKSPLAIRKSTTYTGNSSKKEILPLVSNLVDLLFNPVNNFKGIGSKRFTIVKDLGITEDSFGNAAGGSWHGEYRKILIKLKKGDNKTIGLTVLAGGGEKIYTYLIVSIDDLDRSHNSLQLNLDKNASLVNDEFYISHSGKLTNGHKGSIKQSKVKNYLKKHAEHLLTPENMIELGVLPNVNTFHNKDRAVRKFIKNLIEYALLRDEIRDKSK